MPDLEELPPRYRRVAERVGKGWTYPETAHDLGLTTRTVEAYIHETSALILRDHPHLERLGPKERVMRWWAVDVEPGGG